MIWKAEAQGFAVTLKEEIVEETVVHTQALPSTKIATTTGRSHRVLVFRSDLINAVAAISAFCFPACNCNQAVCSIGYYLLMTTIIAEV
jgi:hypothetical protein